MKTPQSRELAEKSVQAAIAAIEIYNKPNFAYREESFALLMTNAWELLLKGKWLLDHGEKIDSLYEYETVAGKIQPKKNRSDNPITLGLVYLAAKLLEDVDSGLEKPCHDNLLALTEIRDNAAHFLNKDLYFGRRVLEVGTASLRNYLQLTTEWFQLDLSVYNFFLMPISFYHGFEAAAPSSLSHYSEQMRRLLVYLDTLEANEENTETSRQQFALRLETCLTRGKDERAVNFRWSNDPAAPAVALREEDVLRNYPMTYKDLTQTMRRRYSDFIENEAYHKLRRPLEAEPKFCIVRLLHPGNPKTSKQRFYNANILQEFDKHYSKRKKQ